MILFINYLVGVIDKAVGPFEKEAFLRQVFDSSFVESDRYASLLVDRIPLKKRLEVLIDVYNAKQDGDGPKLARFVKALVSVLSSEEHQQFCEMVSQELETARADATVRSALEVVPPDCWASFSEIARFRTENRLIEAIRVGRYDPTEERCTAGALGTWGSELRPLFIEKDRLLATLARKLESQDKSEHDYVFTFFFPQIVQYSPKPTASMAMYLKKGLKAGDVRFRDAVTFAAWEDPTNAWALEFETHLKEFVVGPRFPDVASEDDVPF